MPELPEVETVRRTLAATLIGATIDRVDVARADVLKPPDAPRGPGLDLTARRRATALLTRGVVADVLRHGKQLAITTQDDRVLIAHLGMTGGFRIASPREQLLISHTHVTWRLASGQRILYADPRRFGYLAPVDGRRELDEIWQSPGPDAATVTAVELGRRCRTTRRAIKTALLDQRVVAGVGNIYADESLFMARIHPETPAGDVSSAKVKRLATVIRSVMATAIAGGGSTIRDYRSTGGAEGTFQNRHQVYARGGEPCTRCQRPLAKGCIAQRTTIWCEACQRRG